MSKKNLLVGIVGALALVGLVAGGALAGEGDYPPLSAGKTSSVTVSSGGKEAASCGRAKVGEGLTVEECLSLCS